MYGYLFPIKYEEEVLSISKEANLSPELIFSVINAESHFRKNAISAKGAVGLMQVLPNTADDVAEKLGLQEFDLQDPETNIKIGSFYLSSLLQTFENLDSALAAYNAGPAKVRAWLKNEQLSKDGKTLKKIPFKETQNYVKKVKIGIKIYSRRQFLTKK